MRWRVHTRCLSALKAFKCMHDMVQVTCWHGIRTHYTIVPETGRSLSCAASTLSLAITMIFNRLPSPMSFSALRKAKGSTIIAEFTGDRDRVPGREVRSLMHIMGLVWYPVKMGTRARNAQKGRSKFVSPLFQTNVCLVLLVVRQWNGVNRRGVWEIKILKSKG